MDREIQGKIVAVTGSANGLGLAMVTSFLENGVKLAIILDLDEVKGNEELARLRQKYGEDRVVFYKCNVLEDLDNIHETIIKNHNYIDILINNAGIIDEKNIKRTMNINSIAVMEWTVKFYKNMSLFHGGKGGTIINVSSIFGYRITPLSPYYHASKGAVICFSKSVGHEWNFEKSGVRVIAMCPGLTHTKLADSPSFWEECSLENLPKSTNEWQETPAIGKGVVEIFKKADSGSVWLVEGSRPAVKIDV